MDVAFALFFKNITIIFYVAIKVSYMTVEYKPSLFLFSDLYIILNLV